MRRVIILALTIALLSISPLFPDDNEMDNTKKEISIVLDNSEKGWNSGDIEKYMQCYHKSEKMRFAGNGSFNFGWENTLKRYKKSYPDKEAMGRLWFSEDGHSNILIKRGPASTLSF